MSSEQPSSITIEDGIDVAGRAAELSATLPDGFCVLPDGFMSRRPPAEFDFRSSTIHLRPQFEKVNLPLNVLEIPGVTIPYLGEKSADIVLPVLFVTASFLSKQPDLMNVALGVIGNYLTDFFKGKAGSTRVKCAIVIEKTEKKTTKNIEYDGTQEGFTNFIQAVKDHLN
jgi:hypothetical protein